MLVLLALIRMVVLVAIMPAVPATKSNSLINFIASPRSRVGLLN